MTLHLLLKDIDEPGLNTLEVYERRGGYGALRRALEPQRNDSWTARLWGAPTGRPQSIPRQGGPGPLR